jgi:hypothetical protein
MLPESVSSPTVSATLPSGVGGVTLTPLYLPPPASGRIGELSPMTASGSLSASSFSFSSPTSLSLVSPPTSCLSPIPEMPALPQAHDHLTFSLESPSSSLLHNMEYSAGSSSNVDNVNLTPRTRQSICRSPGPNLTAPPVAALTVQWPHEASHGHIPTIPSGFPGAPPMRNHPFPVDQPSGGYAPHDVQYVDPAITVGHDPHRPGVAYYNNRAQPIQSDYSVEDQKPHESLSTWTISETIHTVFSQPFPAIPALPWIVVSARDDAEPHWNESSADSVAHVTGMVSTTRQGRHAQSSSILVPGHQAPVRGRVVLRDTASLSTSPMPSSSRAQNFLTRGATNVLIFHDPPQVVQWLAACGAMP